MIIKPNINIYLIKTNHDKETVDFYNHTFQIHYKSKTTRISMVITYDFLHCRELRLFLGKKDYLRWKRIGIQKWKCWFLSFVYRYMNIYSTIIFLNVLNILCVNFLWYLYSWVYFYDPLPVCSEFYDDVHPNVFFYSWKLWSIFCTTEYAFL